MLIESKLNRNEKIRELLERLAVEIHPWERSHAERVMVYSLATAEQLGMGKEDMERLQVASALHDVGKLRFADGPWKHPERALLEAESDLVRGHASEGAALLAELGYDSAICKAVAQHHERMDGSGYPARLEGDEICTMAKIIGLAEYFDGIAFGPWSKRGTAEARKWVLANWPGLWGQDIFDAFLAAEDIVDPLAE